MTNFYRHITNLPMVLCIVLLLHAMCFLLGCVLDPFQIDLESVLLNKLNALHQKMWIYSIPKTPSSGRGAQF